MEKYFGEFWHFKHKTQQKNHLKLEVTPPPPKKRE